MIPEGYIPGVDRRLFGRRVLLTGMYGDETRGTLIGYVTVPSYIVEDDNGERHVLSHKLTTTIEEVDG